MTSKEKQVWANRINQISNFKMGDRLIYNYGGSASHCPPLKATVSKIRRSFIEVIVDGFTTDIPERLNAAGIVMYHNTNYFMFLSGNGLDIVDEQKLLVARYSQ
jgi:hypothetical protein